VSIALREPPDLDGDAGGIVARRAVIRWGWRLFRREWRQQLLVLGLLTVAVAAAVWGTSVVTNSQLPNATYATLGTAAASATLPGADPQLAADIAAIQGRWGPADLIESQTITAGSAQPLQLLAESPHGHYNAPLLGLVSGAYPAGPGQVALTSGVAAEYGAHVGGTWQPAGRVTWRVTGIAANPSNLADQFALVAPGQITHPSQVTVLLGPAAAQAAGAGGTLPGVPAATVTFPNGLTGGLSPAVPILLVEVLGLAFIGLLSVASFSVLAQRRLRALGMLTAIGATERNLRLVMVANGLAVGATAALAGAAGGLAAWFAYAPTLQQDTGHVVDAAHLPWWAFAIGIALAIATAGLASRRPAKAMAAVPVVTALSGRPAPPKAPHRSALPGLIVFAAGLACLALSGGLNAVAGGNGPQSGGGGANGHALLLLGGLVATVTGVCLLAPFTIGVLAAGAGRRLPVAIRIALRDLVRYRARSGAALAATTFAVFLAMGICVVASIKFDNPLNWIGPNLSSSQLLVPTNATPGIGQSEPLTGAQVASLNGRVNSLAASLHASVVPLEGVGSLYQTGTPRHGPQNFSGNVYVATPQLLAAYGIKAGQIAPGTDFLTMRPGLAGLPHMEMLWHNGPVSDASNPATPGSDGGPPCTPGNNCVASPPIQTVSALPGGTDAPNTVITEYAVRTYHMQPQLFGWLIQAPAPLTAAQLNAARQLGRPYEVTVEIATYYPSLSDFTDRAIAAGIVIALSVLAMSVGLIRSETAPDLRTLTATGASGATRRAITAATAAALGLLGAILGMAGAVIAGMAWTRSGLTATAGGVPVSDIVILLIGLPLLAAVGGWLLAGREPPAIARQPIE
jgi:putative ABC transport system permease protein